jgi:hypothetical protein
MKYANRRAYEELKVTIEKRMAPFTVEKSSAIIARLCITIIVP